MVNPDRRPDSITTCSCSMPRKVGFCAADQGKLRTIFGVDATGANMDELDSAIIRHLQEDARQSNREIARKVGIAPSTCLERIRLLRQRGVIQGYHANIDLGALNRGVQAIVATQVRPLSREVV